MSNDAQVPLSHKLHASTKQWIVIPFPLSLLLRREKGHQFVMDMPIIAEVLTLIEKQVAELSEELAVESTGKRDPFRVLVSCILSLRTREETTREASSRLFRIVSSPKELLEIKTEELERAIYPVGFWRTKAKTLQRISAILLKDYGGTVPGELDELLKLPGVGRKTANLVVSVAFDNPGICVDTHVHRIMNRLGFVSTHSPLQTEWALREKLPLQYWKSVNRILVLFGRNVCSPISPRCSMCRVESLCERVGVELSR
jgi:endonuclease-3